MLTSSFVIVSHRRWSLGAHSTIANYGNADDDGQSRAPQFPVGRIGHAAAVLGYFCSSFSIMAVMFSP